MIRTDITASLIERQDLIIQIQQLAACYPETGINPDNPAALPIAQLEGIFNCLKRLHFENGGNG